MELISRFAESHDARYILFDSGASGIEYVFGNMLYKWKHCRRRNAVEGMEKM